MSTFVAQLKRELWEHPALYVAPAVIGALLIVCSAALLIGGGAGGLIQISIDVVNEQRPDLTDVGVTLGSISLLPAFMLPLIVIVSFYLLDCLVAERRDRSILFFKSLPVSDVTTVLSKVVTALLVAPGLALAAFVVTQLAVFALISIALAFGDGSVGLLWSPTRLLAVWAFALYTVLAGAIWYAPGFAFLLAISAWARRAPFLWANSPLLLLLVELVLTGRSRLGQLLLDYATGFWTTAFRHQFRIAVGEEQARELLEATDLGGGVRLTEWMDPLGLLTSPMLWLGLLVATTLVAGAVYIRRYRDDS